MRTKLQYQNCYNIKIQNKYLIKIYCIFDKFYFKKFYLSKEQIF